MKQVSLLIIILCSISIISADNFLTITDSRERRVSLESEPQRIISLAPAITEIIYALGGEEKLVGRTIFCDYPASAMKIPSVGALHNPEIEKMLALNPDIIIAGSHFQQELLKKLTTLKIKVIIIDNLSGIQGIYKNIHQVSMILNKESRGETLIEDIQVEIADIRERVKGKVPPRVYYVIAYGEYGDYTAGGDTFISELIEMAGGDNIAKDSLGWAYSVEKVMEKNPDILICSKYNGVKDGLINTPGYRVLPAVKKGNVFEIDNNLIDRQGPRIAQGLRVLASILHLEGE